jgi:signal transduction histidine kinase
VLSGAAAVAFAGLVMARPPAQTWFLPPSPFTPRGFLAACGLVGLVWAVTGAVLVRARPRNALGWLVLAVGVSHAWAVGLTAYGWLDPLPSWPAYIGPALYVSGWLIPPTLLLALYPDGRLPGALWRWPVAVAALAIVALTVLIPFPVVGPEETHGWVMVPTFPERLADVLALDKTIYDTRAFVSEVPDASTLVFPPWWATWTSTGAWVFKPLLALSILLIWVGTVVRLVRARPPRRQQLAWLVCAVMLFLVASFAVDFAYVLVFLAMLLVPVAVAVGVLRYRLLGIEAVVRRGVVYGAFTAAVVGAYVIVTVLAGVTLDSRRLPGVVAAAVAAAALAPARDRLQRAADRLLYGERGDPLRAVSRLGEQVATGELDLLPGAVSSVMAAVHAPGAAVTARDGRVITQVGVEPGASGTATLPLFFGGQHIGELRVAPRRPGEAYTSAESRLLAALAGQVAVVVRAYELTQELEAEHDRVLAAAETERDRLRRDLHDGLGPSLSGVGLGLQALGDRLDGKDPGSRVLLDRIQEEVATALGEVRQIIDGLRPTALDTLGLVSAIRRHAETVSAALPVEVVAADLPPLPPEVETAAYRITTEALTNAARHAGASRVQVSLAAPDGSLHITVADDGHGVGAAMAGVGLTSMRRRTESLGGRLDIESAPQGTTVAAVLPLET